MNAPKSPPVILSERDDAAIDKLLDDPSYGPNYLVSVDISRKGGNLTNKLRVGIQCPLVRVKTVAQALCELVTGGGQLKIDVWYDAGNGNKKKLLMPWWESFADAPRMGKPYEDMTLVWDDTGGENGDGAWITGPRGGTAARAAESPPSGGYGFGSAVPPEFPRPVRGLGGSLMPPPPQLQSLLPASFRNYPADQQWQILAANYEQTTGRKASLEPIDIMQQWKSEKGAELGDTRAEKARLEERHDSLKDQSRREIEAANRKILELERKVAETLAANERAIERAEAKAREEKRDLELQQLREEIKKPRVVAEPKAASPLGGIDPIVITTAITAFTTMQTAAADRQMQMMLAMMKPAAPPPPQPGVFEQMVPLITVIAPVLTPIVTSILASRDPEKLNELESERSLRQMQLAQMLMEQVRQLAPAEETPPIWYPPVMALIQGMMGSLQTAAFAAGAKGLPALPSAPAQQAPQPERRVVVDATVHQQPAQQAAPAAEERPVDQQQIEVPPPDLEKQIDQLEKVDPAAGSVTRLVMRTIASRELDPRFLTPEWTSIVFAVHHRPQLDEDGQRARIATLVQSVVDHLEHCREYQLLPIQLAGVFENPEGLQDFVSLMPLYMMDREYATFLLGELVEEIRSREDDRRRQLEEGEDGSEDDEDEDEDEEDDDEETQAAGGSR